MTHRITKKIVSYKVLNKDDIETVKQESQNRWKACTKGRTSGSAARLYLQIETPQSNMLCTSP